MTLRSALAAVILALFQLWACVAHIPIEIIVPRPTSAKIPLRAALVLSETFSKQFPPSGRPPGAQVYGTGKAILTGIEETTRLAFSEVEVVASTDDAFRSETVQVALVPEVVVWNNDVIRPLMKIRWTILDKGNRVVWQETITTQNSWAELNERGALPSAFGCSNESAGKYFMAAIIETAEAQFKELLDRLVAQPWWVRLVRAEARISHRTPDAQTGESSQFRVLASPL